MSHRDQLAFAHEGSALQIEHEGAKRELLGCHETIFAGFWKNSELFATRLGTSAIRLFHVAVNRGSKPAVFLGARNEPTAQESVVMYPEMDARVP